MSRTIKDILWDFHVKTTKSQGYPPYDQALKEIETLIKDSKPKEPKTKQEYYNNGYRNGVDYYEANLLKILGGEK